jgi:hypothetical protein
MITGQVAPGAASEIAQEIYETLCQGELPGSNNGVAEMVVSAPSFLLLAVRAAELSEDKSADWFVKETLCHIIIGVEFARRLYGIDTSERMCEN